MAGRQNGAKIPTELDLKSLDLQTLDDHEVTGVKEKEKADPDAAPPMFGQGIGLHLASARSPAGEKVQQRVADHSKPILKKGSGAPDVDNRSWKFVEDHSQNDIMLCKICLDMLVQRWCHTLSRAVGSVSVKSASTVSHQQREAAIREDKKPRYTFCRKAEFRLIENLDLKKSIEKLKVYCLYRGNGCMWSGKLQEGKAHLQECVFYPIDCPNGCREYGKIERRNLAKHLAECPIQIEECSFEHIGCESKDPLPRKEVQVHSNRDIHNHLLLLAQSNIRLYEEYNITHATLHSNHDEMMKEKTARIKAQKQELASLEQTIESLEADLLDLTQKINNLKEAEDTKRERCSAQLSTNNNEARKLQGICQAIRTEIQPLPIPQATGILCPPVTFTIDYFTLRKNADEEWISPPFYTHHGGYKMCLTIHLNGYEKARGTHVSVYVHMMSGEFDDHLQWPFPGAIINVSALSQRNAIIGGVVGSRGSYCEAIMLSGQRTLHVRSQVYDSGYGQGYGQQQYIPHGILNQYLARDVFKIVVYHIQFLPL